MFLLNISNSNLQGIIIKVTTLLKTMSQLEKWHSLEYLQLTNPIRLTAYDNPQLSILIGFPEASKQMFAFPSS